MGRRMFTHTETEDSRIQWTKADAITARKLAHAIRNNAGLTPRGFGRILLFLPVLAPIAILMIFWKIVQVNPPPLWLTVIVLSAGTLMFAGILTACIRYLPYVYPEKQSDIWIFRAVCSDIFASGPSSDALCFAAFQQGGGHIRIEITYREYKANPTGKEYIFYKFNERRNNRWAAIAADKLEKEKD